MCRSAAYLLASIAAVLAPAIVRADDPGVAFFETHIRPALVEHCYKCHSSASKKLGGGLLLDSREGVRKGGESGQVIEPGRPDDSLLIKAVRYDDDSIQMPPKGKLPASVVADLEAWVKKGAPDPRDSPPVAKAAGSWEETLRS